MKPTIAEFPRSPTQVLELFLDEKAIEHLRSETIKYASQNGNHIFTVSSGEIRTFIGILLLSGYSSVSRRRLYWSNEPDTRNELVVQSMRRNRFEEIMKYLHAADNHQLVEDDKFAKIRPFLQILNDNFLQYGAAFGPGNISIDESMVPYFGRHPSKQFIRGKPIRWGYKAWVAASPFGYVYSLNFYQGKFQESLSLLNIKAISG